VKNQSEFELTKRKSLDLEVPSEGSIPSIFLPDSSKSSSEILRLKKIKGQVSGLEKMYQDRRYCIDIIQQIRACSSALKSLERETLRKHLQKCVKEAVRNQDNQQVDTKFAEIFNLLK